MSYSKKFKKSCEHVDKDNYKEARNEVQKLIRTRKKAYFERKLTENIIGNPKNVWKILKSLDLKLEGPGPNINCLEKDIPLILMLKIKPKILVLNFECS